MGLPEREKEKKERKNYPTKCPNLRHCQARSQSQGLREYQRRASRLQPGPSPAGDRESGTGLGAGAQPEQERGNLSPTEASSTKRQEGFQMLTKISWDSGRLVSAGRVTASDQLPRRHMAHLSRARMLPPRKPSGGDGGGEKTQSPPGETALSKHLVA